MRWLQRRLIALLAVISLLIIISFLSWKQSEFPDYLPEEAHKYFHPDETQKTTPRPLDHVIQEFVQRPILTYDEAVQLNSPGCPTEGVNFDQGSVRENEQKWRNIPSTKISDWRHDIAAYLQKKNVSKSSEAKHGQGGTGIVMAAGDHDAVIRARTNIRFLRSYNCSLPVEVFHFPNELSEPDKSLLSDDQELEDGASHGGSNIKVAVRVVEGIEKGNGWKAFESRFSPSLFSSRSSRDPRLPLLFHIQS
jgi:alpha 1,2-mannosyltransferase